MQAVTHKSMTATAAAGTVRRILNFDGFMFFSIQRKEEREKRKGKREKRKVVVRYLLFSFFISLSSFLTPHFALFTVLFLNCDKR